MDSEILFAKMMYSFPRWLTRCICTQIHIYACKCLILMAIGKKYNNYNTFQNNGNRFFDPHRNKRHWIRIFLSKQIVCPSTCPSFLCPPTLSSKLFLIIVDFGHMFYLSINDGCFLSFNNNNKLTQFHWWA